MMDQQDPAMQFEAPQPPAPQDPAPQMQQPAPMEPPMPPAGGPDINAIVQKRLAQERQKTQGVLEALRAENEALKAQSPQHDGEQMIPISAIPHIQEQIQSQNAAMQRATDIKDKVATAAEQDPELKELMTKGNGISDGDLSLMGKLSSIPNIVAVTKRLLKDPTDHSIFTSAPNDYEKQKFIKELSDKLDGRNNGMSATKKYEPTAQLSGSSPSDDDMSEYVKKYSGKRK